MNVIVAFLALLSATTTTVEKTPTDDVWVYPHASDPSKDAYLRVWGAGGKSVAPKGEAEDFSYSYLKFDLSDVPAGAKIKTAKLTLWQTPDPTYSASDAKAAPLEARTLSNDFSEKTWGYELVNKLFPAEGKDAIYGVAELGAIKEGKEILVTIDLLKGPASFQKALDANKIVGIGLTSSIDPGELGNHQVYKVYSKDGPKEFRPVLKLEYD